MSITDLTLKHIATGVVGVIVAALLLVLAGFSAMPVPAQALTQSEANAIIAALGGSNPTVSALIQALVTTGSGSTSGGTGYTFTRSLSQGATGEDVRQLQIALNNLGHTVSASGAGSLGNESTYFGALTKAAVVKFQNANASEVLAPVGLTAGTGYFGPSSRAKMNSL